MNKLFVGFKKSIDLSKGGYLLIDDEARDIPDRELSRSPAP
jgi:hypothetical protein